MDFQPIDSNGEAWGPLPILRWRKQTPIEIMMMIPRVLQQQWQELSGSSKTEWRDVPEKE